MRYVFPMQGRGIGLQEASRESGLCNGELMRRHIALRMSQWVAVVSSVLSLMVEVGDAVLRLGCGLYQRSRT